MEKLKQSGPLFIITAAVLWSLDGLLRTTLYSLSPAVVVFWEHVLGFLLLSPFAFRSFGVLRKFGRREWLSLAAVSLFSGALGTILYTAALGQVRYIQFSVVVLLQQLQPIWAILTASALLKERISPAFARWAAIAVAASYFVTFRDLRVNFSADTPTLIAAVLAVVAGVMWGTSTSFSKIILKKASFVEATYLRFMLTPVFAFAIILLFPQKTPVTALEGGQWLTLLVIALTTGMVSILIYYYGLRQTQAKVSAICELAWPASAILIDYLYFHRPLSLTQAAGTVIMLLAIYQVSISKTYAKQMAQSRSIAGQP